MGPAAPRVTQHVTQIKSCYCLCNVTQRQDQPALSLIAGVQIIPGPSPVTQLSRILQLFLFFFPNSKRSVIRYVQGA